MPRLYPFLTAVLLVALVPLAAAEPPVRGFCIAAPTPEQRPRFESFIANELAPRGINTLVLRIDFNFDYRSHPELRGANPLTLDDARSLADTCRAHGIELVPQINLLGHQSWAENLGNLLRVYPEFDETPGVAMPEKYSWPNEDGLYCKSYCPLHPDVHDVVFALVDEVMDAFEAKSFHAGMDEVFYIADENCPRCAGKDPAELFAGEVTRIRNHLTSKQRTLWIWGDRLLDGKTTGLGMWEASENGTAPAIDLIPQDVVICDWHYERAESTYVYFAMKGFSVITCPWNRPAVAIEQKTDFERFQANANPTLSRRYLGLMQTVWTSNERFLDAYEGRLEDTDETAKRQATVDTFKAVFPVLSEKR